MLAIAVPASPLLKNGCVDLSGLITPTVLKSPREEQKIIEVNHSLQIKRRSDRSEISKIKPKFDKESVEKRVALSDSTCATAEVATLHIEISKFEES